MSKTPFPSFPGLLARRPFGGTGESRTALDARLQPAGMTYKAVMCGISNDRISNFTVPSDTEISVSCYYTNLLHKFYPVHQ